jgi:hypothetical protein
MGADIKRLLGQRVDATMEMIRLAREALPAFNEKRPREFVEA